MPTRTKRVPQAANPFVGCNRRILRLPSRTQVKIATQQYHLAVWRQRRELRQNDLQLFCSGRVRSDHTLQMDGRYSNEVTAPAQVRYNTPSAHSLQIKTKIELVHNCTPS